MIYVHGIGHFHPKNIITNEFLESLDIGLDCTSILQRLGIVERRTVLPLDYIRHTRNRHPGAANEHAEFSNAETGMLAARMAMERADLLPEDIGLVIAGGYPRCNSSPAESSSIAEILGIKATAFDLHSTCCASFVIQCHFLNNMNPDALPDFVLLLNSENKTRGVDYSNPQMAAIWGDATAAAVLSPRVRSRTFIDFTLLESNEAGLDEEGFYGTLRTMQALRAHGGDEFVPSAFIGHQASRFMLESVCSEAGIEASRHLFNVDLYGNGGAAGAPSVVSQNWDSLPRGASMVAVAGSGPTRGGFLLNRC